ncbi:hypothetical protein MASR1M46_19760 [Bacteroidales bacterium]
MKMRSTKIIDDSFNLVMDACKNGNIAVLSYISEGNNILNQIETGGESPLIVACRSGHFGIVKFILQHELYVIDPVILAKAASVAKEQGNDRVRSLLTLYYIKYCRYSA